MLVLFLIVPLGGGGGIRTHGPVSQTPVFKTGTFDHSVTPPIHSRLSYQNAYISQLK